MTQPLTVQGYPTNTRGAAFVPRRIQGLQALGQWKAQDMAATDLWLRQEICIAFQQMVCLTLAGQPAVEILPMTAEMWVITVGEGMIEDIDRERLKAGFRLLYRSLKWWPQPVELLKILPLRPQRTKLPEPKISDEDHERQAQKLQDIMDMLNSKDKEENDNGI